MGSGDLWIYIGLHLYVSFKNFPGANLLMLILRYRSSCQYNMMLSKLMHIKYHQKGPCPFPCITREKEM